MKYSVILWGLLLAMLTCSCTRASKFPPMVVPNGWGVNIHFAGEPQRDLDMIQAGGWRFIRMDVWPEWVEPKKGVYDFTRYDQLTAGLAKRGIRPLFVLQTVNFYGAWHTDEWRQGFANYAAATVAHFKGQGVIWELCNEPNASWKPADYVDLAKVVIPAMRKADPEATIVAPACARMDIGFLEACFQRGLLPLIDGLTVHLYRLNNPETVVGDIARLHALIARYNPDRPDLPIISGEWGYSTAWGGYTPELQGQFIARQYLVNLSQGIPVSIWYDWHDDGPPGENMENHFGTVTYQDYTPKPSYLEAQRLVAALNGMHFVKRLTSSPEDYLFVFADREHQTIAAWTTGAAHAATIGGQTVTLSGDPQYLPMPTMPDALRAESAWTCQITHQAVPCGATPQSLTPEFIVTVHNPFTTAVPVTVSTSDAKNLTGKFIGKTSAVLAVGKTMTFRWKGRTPLRRDGVEKSLLVTLSINHQRSAQRVEFIGTNDLSAQLITMRGGNAAVMLTFPENDVFQGELRASVGDNISKVSLTVDPVKHRYTAHLNNAQQTPLPLIPTEHGAVVQLSNTGDASGKPLRLQLFQRGVLVADTGINLIKSLNLTTTTTVPVKEGDPRVSATYTLTDVKYDDADSPVLRGMHFSYEYNPGWVFVCMKPHEQMMIADPPSLMGFWVRGNAHTSDLNMRFVDMTGRVFQVNYARLNFTGWRFLTANMEDIKSMGQWDGAGMVDTIHYPIRIDTFVIVDGGGATGEVDMADFQLIYKK